ncbi:hypothetical protein AAFJ72_19695 [Brevibacillus gelatini]|uniref:hypothetical protein n=1 Tax=Brevibacillus gelatini TaxID=1655277 RepID=UPI003D81A629
MKKTIGLLLAAVLVSGVGTVYAISGSPYGKLGEYERVALSVDRTPITEKGILINGQVYVPVEPLYRMNKLGYFQDPSAYEAHLFFGGKDSYVDYYGWATTRTKSISEIEEEIMKGIPYESDRYHSGMMKQDILNITILAKTLIMTSQQIDSAVHLKLTQNVTPNFELIRQGVHYRTLPIAIMEERMEALADELGRQIGSRERRKMEDVIDELDEAVRNKEKALEALEDWVRTSDEDDLDDYRRYEERAKENVYAAVKLLTGEDLENPGKNRTDSLKHKVDAWINKNK